MLVTHDNEPCAREVTLSAGASLSAAMQLPPGHYPAALVMPAAWTAANITVQACVGAACANLYDAAGNEVTVTAAAGRYIALDRETFHTVSVLKLRSGTAATPVAQVAARTLQVIARPL